ncbi:MAG TPA: hypothetical protein VMF89_18590 [Polyangiales bacterium]|nr:hypothetical protein [Polyangiales bacterium]
MPGRGSQRAEQSNPFNNSRSAWSTIAECRRLPHAAHCWFFCSAELRVAGSSPVTTLLVLGRKKRASRVAG